MKKKSQPAKSQKSEVTHTPIAARAGYLNTKVDKFESGLLSGRGSLTMSSPSGVTHSNALQYEDDFNGIYGVSGAKDSSKDVVIIEPPYNPLTLEKLSKHNNALGPCIDAMETNIDGTGFEIIKREGKTDKNDETAKTLHDFFSEPWPGCSFTTVRKALRRDMETVGYGFLEVIRNPLREVMFIRHIEAKTMRLCQLGDPIIAKRKVIRNGKELEATVALRFRRFVQKIGTAYVYFKEFQSDLDMDKLSGEWAKPGQQVPFDLRASEILYFTIDQDVNTPYGVPRWIPQMPSVLGSRQAEENNLTFFESGGVPPFMLIVQGGILAQEARDALETALSDKGVGKQRGVVVEVQSASGSLDDTGGNVKVAVEKFGAEKQNDSSFEGYDDKCELKIRGSFRLPAIFVGRADSYNFATAFASYMVGEAQCFKPERDEFDEVISLRLFPVLVGDKAKEYKFRSLPIVVNDAKERLSGVKMAQDAGAITKGDLVDNINEITGLSLKCAEGEEDVLCQPSKTQGATSDSALSDASTASPTDPQGTSGVAKKNKRRVQSIAQ